MLIGDEQYVFETRCTSTGQKVIDEPEEIGVIAAHKWQAARGWSGDRERVDHRQSEAAQSDPQEGEPSACVPLGPPPQNKHTESSKEADHGKQRSDQVRITEERKKYYAALVRHRT